MRMLHNYIIINFRITECLLLLMVLVLTACSDNSLNSLKGPKSGKVSGLMCTKLEILTAAREQPSVQGALISKGHCLNERYAKKVKVIRTVMMPADGKYSQILWPKDDKKYWVRTEEIR